MNHVVRSLLLCLAIFLSSKPALAWDTSWPTTPDLALLPPYCKALLVGGAGSPEYQQWASTLGDGFGHSHHYCAGLNFVRRAGRAVGNAQDVRAYYSQAITEFTYVIERSPNTFVLLPQILVDRGNAYARLKQSSKALEDYEKSIALKPDYVRAYASLTDFYVNVNMIAEAKETLQRGLKNVPTSTYLTSRLQDIDRKSR